jgi:hypothetical protein
MKKKYCILYGFFYKLLIIFWVSLLFQCTQPDQQFENALEFITAADMRYYIEDVNPSARHFMGALVAIKKAGPGKFLISTGDIDPPWRVKAAIDSILGKDYPWYPVIGNHELEDSLYVAYLRNYPQKGPGLMNLVRSGPAGCQETTYSFDWGNCHFVVLNQYYDGQSDVATDGDVVPALLEWLKEDLAANRKKFIFVFGHEPIFPMPDMDTGRMRHYDNSLNKYMENNIAFQRLLIDYEVKAYICGHSHNTSYANFNGLWQIDTGHSRGLEGISPIVYFPEVLNGIQEKLDAGMDLDEAVEEFYSNYPDQKDIQKGLEYMDFSSGLPYGQLTRPQIIRGLSLFFQEVQQSPQAVDRLTETFWRKVNYAPSTFIKFYVGKSGVKADFYRDDGQGGEYFLRKSMTLN